MGAEGIDDALDDRGPQEGGVAGGGEANRGGSDGEPGRKASEGAAFGLPVLDDGLGDGGVHGGKGLAGGGDDHDLVDGRRERVAHPLEEGATAQVGGSLVGPEAAAQPARDDDAGDALTHGLRVRERGSL